MIERIKQMTLIEWLVVGTVIVGIPLVIIGAIAEQRQWDEYARVNRCEVTETRRVSHTYYDVNLKMPQTQYRTEHKYECRDGMVHWR